MCPFVIVIIMIALVLFMPAVYQMGKIRGYKSKKVENAEGGNVKSVVGMAAVGAAAVPPLTPTVPTPKSTNASVSTYSDATLPQKGLPSVLPPTKCTSCKKMNMCANPPPGMGVFCL